MTINGLTVSLLYISSFFNQLQKSPQRSQKMFLYTLSCLGFITLKIFWIYCTIFKQRNDVASWLEFQTAVKFLSKEQLQIWSNYWDDNQFKYTLEKCGKQQARKSQTNQSGQGLTNSRLDTGHRDRPVTFSRLNAEVKINRLTNRLF